LRERIDSDRFTMRDGKIARLETEIDEPPELRAPPG
jgi:hypothetical protein